MLIEKERIVFYDGDCGFCNSAVQFILKKRKRDFYFVKLQSAFAQEKLAEHGIEIKLDTLYYLNKNRIYERSGAALRICAGLKGLYPLLQVFLIIPSILRDWLYNFIAKRRHKLRAGFCAIPTEEERNFFL